jgi:hypothetical protein
MVPGVTLSGASGPVVEERRMPGKAVSMVLGLVGAAIGGGLGYLAFKWLASYNLYGLVLPGALLGLGAGLLSGRPSTIRGIICGVLAVLLGLLSEALVFPFVADNSLPYFASHLHQLKPPTWLMIAVGAIIAYWWGRERIPGIWRARPTVRREKPYEADADV